MANKKITELSAATSLAATDVVPVVDVSADETKKITATDLFRTLPDGTAAAPALAFSSDAANGLFLASSDTVGIATGGTQRVTVDGSGNVTISGDLQVNGATTTVQSTTVTIDDKNIELGSVASPSNTTADGGGITLKGATDKEIKWVNSTGYWTFNTGIEVGGHLQIDDTNEIRVGTGQDLKIYHDGSNSYIADAGTGNLFIRANSQLVLESNNGENYLAANENGDVHLYYDGGVRISTKSDGANVVGELECDSLDVDGNIDIHATRISYSTSNEAFKFLDGIKSVYGNGDDLQIYHDGSTSFIKDAGTGVLAITSNGGHIALLNGDATENLAKFIVDGAAELYHNGAKKFETLSTGASVTGNLGIGATNNTSYDISAQNLLVSDTSSNCGITIRSGGGTPFGAIHFADGTSSNAEKRAGRILYGHSGDFMTLNTANTEALRINSDGRLLVGTTTTSVHGDRLIEIGNTSRSATFQAITTSTSGTGGIVFADTTTNDTGGYRGIIQYAHSSDSLQFSTAATERLRITSTGLIDVSGGIQVSENVTPTSGSGVEIFKASAFSGQIQAYNRDSSAWMDLKLKGNNLQFFANNSERLRIDTAGRLLLGTTTEGEATADNLTIADSGHCGMTVRSGTSSEGNIFFSDGTSGNAEFRGAVRYFHALDDLTLTSAATERLRINSNGAWGIEGASNYGTSGQVLTSNGNDSPTWQAQATAGGSNTISMNDNVKINFGASNDLQIYHDGNHSQIKDSGTGNLQLLTSAFKALSSDGSETYISAVRDGAVELYHNNSKKLETKSDGVDIIGELQCDSLDVDGNVDITGTCNFHNGVGLQDNDKLFFGAAGDLEIYHDGNNSFIKDTGTGRLTIATSQLQLTNAADSEVMIRADQDGEVNLYYNGVGKLATVAAGIDVTGEVQCDSLDVDGDADFGGGKINFDNGGNVLDFADSVAARFGTGNDLRIYHDGSHSYVSDASTGNLKLTSNGTAVQIEKSNGENMAIFRTDAGVELYYDNSKKIETNTNGVRVSGRIEINGTNGRIEYNNTANTFEFFTGGNKVAEFLSGGHFVPGSNNTYDLGSNSYRWRNVYTNDLNLSNEGSSNDVDGTWGNYTIQEGEDDLFLINRRNGKKYKFNLTEVS